MTVFIDSFSGAVADLKRPYRNSDGMLSVFAKHPMVSVWDMSELPWLRYAIKDLESRGLIEMKKEPYPWIRYEVKK